jgi:hypothetical protein
MMGLFFPLGSEQKEVTEDPDCKVSEEGKD